MTRRIIVEAIGWTGSACVLYGCWLAWQPLAFVVLGLMLLMVALLRASESPR